MTNGALADVSDKLGRTALHNAALEGNDEALQALLKAGAQVDSRFQVNSWPKQQLENHFISYSDNIIDVECQEITSDFKVSRRGDNIAEVSFHHT